jgi:hypothetical protein
MFKVALQEIQHYPITFIVVEDRIVALRLVK